MFGCFTSANVRTSAAAAAMASASPEFSKPLSTTQRSCSLRSIARYTHPSPPCARHPRTSYCPATRSPGESLGTNEYRVPHWTQTPSSSPDCPSRLRPTGFLQSGLPQYRRASGTCGSVITAVAGLRFGIRGSATIPAPSRPRVLAPRDNPRRVARTARAVETLAAAVGSGRRVASGSSKLIWSSPASSAASLSVPILRLWRTGRRAEVSQPGVVEPLPGSVDAHALQHAVDEPDQVVALPLDPD